MGDETRALEPLNDGDGWCPICFKMLRLSIRRKIDGKFYNPRSDVSRAGGAHS